MFLARAGVHVTLFDAAAAPFARASRWNEGKIHLGYLYAADTSMQTVHRLLPGGLGFRPLTEQLIGRSLAPAVTLDDEIYLVHRESVVSDESMRSHYERVTELARSHPEAKSYLCDLSRAKLRRLSEKELRSLVDIEQVVAGYAVPERSVATTWVADRFIEAIDAETRITQVMGVRIRAVCPASPPSEENWCLVAEPNVGERFDAVVNALWEGGIAVDRTVGLNPAGPWSHRLRVSVFSQPQEPIHCPSFVIATGPFGDVKNYGERGFYLSWYEAGLLAEGEELEPPAVPMIGNSRKQAIADEIFARLGAISPAVKRLHAATGEIRVEGGWVFAIGTGRLNDRRSTLHRRDSVGLRQLGTYFP